jgi:hypothetical protein
MVQQNVNGQIMLLLDNKNPTKMAKLEFNGYVRFDKLDGNYFNYV